MNKQVLITGGSRGIGKSLVEEFAKNGHQVVFTYSSNKDSADQLIDSLKNYSNNINAIQLNLTDSSQIESVAEQVLKILPELDTIINNAGISIDGLFLRVKPEDLENLVQTNVMGAYFLTQKLLKPMLKKRSGSILFLSSVIGQRGNAGQTAYSITKAALLGLTKSLALELASRNIRVNAIAPGFIETDMTSGLPEQTKQSILSQIPLEKFGEPNDIAKAASFLSSDDAKYITGQILAVNGGLYL